MLNRATITDWRRTHPWTTDAEVEVDLLLEGLIHELFTSAPRQFLFIGGTCLHKLHTSTPGRYSEDIDLIHLGGSDQIDDVLHDLKPHVADLGFTQVDVISSKKVQFPKLLCYFPSVDGRLHKIKVDVNLDNTNAHAMRVHRSLVTQSMWIRRESSVQCASKEAISGMKILAATNRRRTRDLFDLWFLKTQLGVTTEATLRWVDQLRHPKWNPKRGHRHVSRSLRRPETATRLKSLLPDSSQMSQSQLDEVGSCVLELLQEAQRQGIMPPQQQPQRKPRIRRR